MRGRMNDAKSYAAAAAAGPGDAGRHGRRSGRDRSIPSTRSATRSSAWAAGRNTAWSMPTQPGALRKVDTTHVPLSHYLGAVGMPGVTAWYGLVKIIAAEGRRDGRRQRRQRRGRQRLRRAGQGARLPRGRHRRRPGQVHVRGRRTRLRRLHRLQGSTPTRSRCAQALKEACPERHRRLLRERRRHDPRRGAAAHERLRPHRAVRHDRRLRRRSRCRMAQPAADPDQPPEARRLHRQRAHGGLARGAEGTGHAGRHRQAEVRASRSRRASRRRPRPSWACSRARTSASNSSS